jgi:hypothetical protein
MHAGEGNTLQSKKVIDLSLLTIWEGGLSSSGRNGKC